MADAITNTMLLEHMQAMKYDLQEQIKGLGRHVGGIDQKLERLAQRVTRLAEDMRQGFEEAREHRQALQEDLDATMRLQFKHSKKLARLGGQKQG